MSKLSYLLCKCNRFFCNHMRNLVGVGWGLYMLRDNFMFVPMVTIKSEKPVKQKGTISYNS